MNQARQRTEQSIAGGRGAGGAGRSARIGRHGEQTAAVYLERRGYRVLDRNWRSGDPAQRGELDLILRHRRVLVVCEVKTRTGGRLAHPAEAVTPEKLGRLRRLAGLWLREQARAPGVPPRTPGGGLGLGLGMGAGPGRGRGLGPFQLPGRRPRPFVPAELRIDVVAVRLGPHEPFPVLAIEHLAGVA